MINVSELEAILTKGNESQSLDFKKEPYRLDNDGNKAKFIKDVISMANTPRENCAYIVIGVKHYPDGRRDLLGVSESDHLDDADLQGQLNSARVEPRPQFVYQPMVVDGKSYGVIEIPVAKDGPYYSKKDFGVLKADRLYFRRGSENNVATAQERRHIWRWFLDKPLNDTIQQQDKLKPYITKWDEFYQACHRFDKNRRYVFIVGKDQEQLAQEWEDLVRLPLSVVLDFDTQTEQTGIYSFVASNLKNYRSVHLWTLGNESSMVPDKACYWYAGRGLEGRELSLVDDDWRQWNRKYGRQILPEFLEKFARSIGGRPVTVINLWYASKYVRSICSMIDGVLGDAADYVFAIPEAERLSNLAGDFGASLIPISAQNILQGIKYNIKSIGDDFPVTASIPKGNGMFHVLGQENLNWLSEDFEVLHSNIELESEAGRILGIDYLKGSEIGWADLANHFDADRNKTESIRKRVESELRSRRTVRLNLLHWPGAGGTTVARRIAWELKRFYPVVLLKRITPSETISRFRELFQPTGQPILVIVEGADIVPDQLDKLYNETRAENIPCVFLNVIRRFEIPQEHKRTIFLGQQLNDVEGARFLQKFKIAAPEKSGMLESILNDPDNRTPFHFALATFGEDYKGLTRYVEYRIKDATPQQQEIITYIALAYYYGHKPILAQIFAPYLGHPENRPLHLEKILDDPQLELLIQVGNGVWRPSHQLIAEEILQIVLAGTHGERRNWKRNLPLWSPHFIEISESSTPIPSDDLLELLRRIFILRNETDLLGTEGAGNTKFAKLIEDIHTEAGRLSIFKKLVELFPDEAHFWGHLGRLYGIYMNEPELAIEALDRAIILSPKDSTLHHMKGMAYRKVVYNNIDELRGKRASSQEVLEQLRPIVENTLKAFAGARELNNDSEHAYISPVQMIIRILDFGYTISGVKTRSEFLTIRSRSTGWYQEILDEAETLMDSVRQAREGERSSRYVKSCESSLNQVYDDYARALQGWDNLLSRSDVYAPPIRRQIVRAYLAKNQRQWASLPNREIERIVDLMEQNLREEPDSVSNIRIWFRAIRYSTRDYIDIALDRLASWRTVGDSLEAYYYLYMLHVLKAIEGSSVEQVRSEDLIKQSRGKSRNQRNRTRSHEWLGKGIGIGRLINSLELGEWDRESGFYADTSRLELVEGRVAQINAPESGIIELSSCGLPVFFVPARAGVEKGRDENEKLTFYLGFSYEGLRAWNVKLLS